MAFVPPPGLYGAYSAVPPPPIQYCPYTPPLQVQPQLVAQGLPPVVGTAVNAVIATPNIGANVGVVVSVYDAEKDSKDLYKAMTGLGTDENTLIRILAHRPREHTERINYLYARRFKDSLFRKVGSDTSFNFKNTLQSLLMPLEEVKARRLKEAMVGVGTKDHSLIDVLAYSTNEEIRRIKREYEYYFGTAGDVGNQLEQDIKSDTSGDFQHILCALLRAERDESFVISEERVREDCKNLWEKGEGRIGTDDSFFIELFTKRSPWHLAAVNDEYQKNHKSDMWHAIKKETSGHYRDTLRACVTPKAVWFAERLNYSMAGLGTHDSLLIFLLTSTTEAERMVIRQKFEELFKKPLKAVITGDTSGDYCNTLLSLVTFGGEEDSHLKGKVKA